MRVNRKTDMKLTSYYDLGYSLVMATIFCLKTVSALGNYEYCCNIAKCHKIAEACRLAQLQANASTCAQICLVDFICEPQKDLATRSYSCFYPFLGNQSDSPLDFVCGQTYTAGLAPAPQIVINSTFCSTQCSGWRLSRWGSPSEWATPIIQYILPSVIFSMTIPRRHKLEVPSWAFTYKFRNRNILRIMGSIFWAGCIVTMDTFVWIFTIFALAGPMLVGGLHEATLDRKIVMKLNDHKLDGLKALLLSPADKGDLLLAVICGNLDLNIGSPQEHVQTAIGLRPGRIPLLRATSEQSTQSLTNMMCILNAQSSFGSTVGAAVLFYLAAFVYTVVGLQANKGDNDTSRKSTTSTLCSYISSFSLANG